jgi:hypothetical protein
MDLRFQDPKVLVLIIGVLIILIWFAMKEHDAA